jgi:hypothetical protein
VNDVRDDALASLLDDSVRGVDPSPDERLSPIRRRGSARRAARWVAVVTALAVSLGAVAWAGLALRTEPSRPGGVTSDSARKGWLTYEDARLGLAFEYPASWQVMPVETTCRVRFLGVLIASEPFGLREEANGCLPSVPSIDFGDPSENLVLVAITRWEGGPSPLPSQRPNTRFPLQLGGDFGQGVLGLGFWPPSLGAFKDLNAVRIPLVVAGDGRYAVRYFSAHSPSKGDWGPVEPIIASIGLIDPCASAPDSGPGLLSCEEAIRSHPSTSEIRIIDAWLDWHGQRRVWAFVSGPTRYYTRAIGSGFSACSEGVRKILIDARTGDFVRVLGVGRFVPCPSVSL